MSDFPSIEELKVHPDKGHLCVMARICRALEADDENCVEVPEWDWPKDDNFIDLLKSKGYRVEINEGCCNLGSDEPPSKVYFVSW